MGFRFCSFGSRKSRWLRAFALCDVTDLVLTEGLKRGTAEQPLQQEAETEHERTPVRNSNLNTPSFRTCIVSTSECLNNDSSPLLNIRNRHKEQAGEVLLCLLLHSYGKQTHFVPTISQHI